MVASRGSPTQVGQGVINELIVEWIVSTDNWATPAESTSYAALATEPGSEMNRFVN
jgi:hypothetical protein